MVAVTFFGTEIFYSRKRHHENKGDQEFKYTEFILGWTLGTYTLCPSLTPPKFTEIMNLRGPSHGFRG